MTLQSFLSELSCEDLGAEARSVIAPLRRLTFQLLWIIQMNAETRVFFLYKWADTSKHLTRNGIKQHSCAIRISLPINPGQFNSIHIVARTSLHPECILLPSARLSSS